MVLIFGPFFEAVKKNSDIGEDYVNIWFYVLEEYKALELVNLLKEHCTQCTIVHKKTIKTNRKKESIQCYGVEIHQLLVPTTNETDTNTAVARQIIDSVFIEPMKTFIMSLDLGPRNICTI